MEPREGESWPVGRDMHAACCLGYAGDHIHLLVTGGMDGRGKALKDVWLFDLSLKKWKEVRLVKSYCYRLVAQKARIIRHCALTKLSICRQ